MKLKHPWLQMEAETPKAFQAFLVYCMLGPQRSLADAWCTIRGVPRGDREAAPTDFKEWSVQHSWSSRVAAYDTWVAQMAIEQDSDYSRRIANKARNAIEACINSIHDVVSTKDPNIRELSSALNALIAAYTKLYSGLDSSLSLSEALPVVLRSLLDRDEITIAKTVQTLQSVLDASSSSN